LFLCEIFDFIWIEDVSIIVERVFLSDSGLEKFFHVEIRAPGIGDSAKISAI
jgi:hypothetical protein